MAGTSTSGSVVLPSVFTFLAPTSSCSVNAALISVLSAPEASLAAIPLQTGTESTAFDKAEDADSESQEGDKISVGILLIVSFCLCQKKRRGDYVCVF